MKAMVLAAGVGSRLRPLTDQLPKALIPIAGRPLIEIVLGRLAAVGVRSVVVNVFHHADQMERHLRSCSHLGLRIEISRETELLDTGGGLKKVAAFFAGTEPFFVHNADVVSGVDLLHLYATHCQSGALATLSVRARRASRLLLLDAAGRLCGWENPATGEQKWAGHPGSDAAQGDSGTARAVSDAAHTNSSTAHAGSGTAQTDSGPARAGSAGKVVDIVATRVGFDGIQVLSPAILDLLVESGPFSLTQAYLRLAGQGAHILACRADDTYWSDVGTLAKLAAVERHVALRGFPR